MIDDNIQLPVIHNAKLRLRALTHRSYVNENPTVHEHNERLEFLGDAILGFLVGELLYHYQDTHQTELSEAKMTQIRATLVNKTQLAELALQLGLADLIRLSKGAIKDRGRQSPAVLSDAFEAYLGAYYLDAGLDAVRDFIIPLFMPLLQQRLVTNSSTTPSNLIDCKNRLQQWALAELGQHPKYYIIQESGPDHAKEFVAEVRVDGQVYGSGMGRRKQDAEKQAALAALHQLGLSG